MHPDETIGRAKQLMLEANISGLPIVTGDRTVAGILTARDLRFQESLDTKVGQVMTRDKLVTAHPGTTLEEAKEILNDRETGRKMEAIRSHAGVVYGVAKDEHSVDVEWPVTPFSAIVMPPCDYTTIQGAQIKAADMSLRAIIWVAHQYHPAYSGTICASTGVGALIPGTVVNEVLGGDAIRTGKIEIGHPSGIMECDAEVEMRDGKAMPKRATYYRTARRIMEGYVYLKPGTMSQDLHI
jgi:2-methylaconitate cis-trans-isomerase PrpF